MSVPAAYLADPLVHVERERVARPRAVERQPDNLAGVSAPLFEQLRLSLLRHFLAHIPPTFPFAFSSAISASVRPSARSTSEVCSPRLGPAGPRRTGVSEKWIGEPICSTSPT